jgi:DNA-binding response OmpR family regulator
MALVSRSRPHGGAPLPIPGDARGAGWLILADEGPATLLPEAVAGIGVLVVSEPRQFRDLLARERPRVVVCGRPPASLRDLELVEAERRRRPSLVVVLISPPDAVDARLDALAHGFDDALSSAVPVDELAGRLAWLDARSRSRVPPARVLRFGPGYELDTAAHELRRNGVVIHLRPKEFGLLAELASRPGRVHTRAELLDRVWGAPQDGGGRTVDVHIRWLRAKLEADPERPVILVTIRGVGYRLDPMPR